MARGAATGIKPTPVPKGAYAPHIIVLLIDGASNAEPLPADAAQQTVDRGIRVYTIGFETAENQSLPSCYPGREPFDGGGQFGGGGFRRGID
jgi:hypothetical protein